MNPHNSSCPRSGTEPGRLGRKDRRPALARAARPRSRSLLSRGNRGPAWWATKHRRQTAGLQSSGRAARAPVRQTRHCWLRAGQLSVNDPSAGSPTETLLRLLLPLNATVWSSSRQPGRVIRQANSPRTSLKRSIGSSDGRCVQRAGT